MIRTRFLLFFFTALPLSAQLGDVPTEPDQVAHAAGNLPPPKALSPAEQLETFRLPPGFKIELLADEKLVHDPSAVAFDLEGNLWVAEMSGFNAEMVKFLPDLAAGAKDLPPGKIVKLVSSQKNGVYDQRIVFVDGLNAPRAISILRDGVLFADPPYLWLARDDDGDGKADQKIIVSDHFGRKGDDESSANGILWGRDNVIQNISHDANYRYRGGKWEEITILFRGQFGLTQDDFGRLFFTRNSDHMRADLYSPVYGARNPYVVNLPWANLNIAENQIIWPGHPTPSANRGYRRGELGTVNGGLRSDGSLMEFSAACGSILYRSNNFPTEFYNNAFIPDAIGNLIKRSIPLEAEGRITLVNAYSGREFLTSTDERFRPVNLVSAPDGSLVVVDMYRGLIEQYNFISSYSKDQILKRELNTPLFGTGRLWRITYEGGPLEKRRPDLLKAGGAELAGLLEHPNSWWRDNAQQAIVERQDKSAVPALQRLAEKGAKEATRVYALWTLDGLDAVSAELGTKALRDSSAKVRSAAVRIQERGLRGADPSATLKILAPLAKDPASEVAVQLALSLGESQDPQSIAILFDILETHGAHPFIPKAIASSLGGREGAFISFARERMNGDFVAERESLLSILVEAIGRRGDPVEMRRVLALAGETKSFPSWARVAVLKGLAPLALASVRRTLPPERLLKASAMESLERDNDLAVKEEARDLANKLKAAEAASLVKKPTSGPLTPAQLLVAGKGKAMYALCAGCHQESGLGLPGAFPPLVTSPWIVGKPENLVRIMLNGKEGTPGFPGGMPPVRSLGDEHIAAIATYVRNAWGLQAGAVDAELVAKVRQETLSRPGPWTDAELKGLE